jgi:stage V sporulation protein D (sporulation-specific penicillin-binding protein)
LKGTEVRAAVGELTKIGLDTAVVGDSTQVVRQFPLPGAELHAGDKVTLYSNMVTSGNKNGIEVPDLKGKSLRAAVQYLDQLNLKVEISGSGIVNAQSPKAGTVVEYGTVCTIACN